jgi:hypothetical protein
MWSKSIKKKVVEHHSLFHNRSKRLNHRLYRRNPSTFSQNTPKDKVVAGGRGLSRGVKRFKRPLKHRLLSSIPRTEADAFKKESCFLVSRRRCRRFCCLGHGGTIGQWGRLLGLELWRERDLEAVLLLHKPTFEVVAFFLGA